MIEILVHQNETLPYYFSKRVSKNYFISENSSLYLYDEIKKDDYGNVTIYFESTNIKIYSKIIQIDNDLKENTIFNKSNYPKKNKMIYYILIINIKN